MSLTGRQPLISIVMPVFNQTRFLREAISSAASQTCPDVELVVYDDYSSSPGVREILSGFKGVPGVKILLGESNEGISMSTNRAIIHSSGEYVAFVDCDDILPPGAMKTVARYIASHPQVHYFYSNRENIDENGNVTARLDFSKYGKKHPADQIIKFMFATHLKVIKKEVFREVGLFKKDFDSCQDYDMALRMSRSYNFFHIPEFLYRYRIHSGQISKVKKRDQSLLAYRARDLEMFRRRILKSDLGNRKISIIILTMNRWQRTRLCLNQLASSTGLPYDLIVLDNNSSDSTVDFLKWYSKQHPNVRLILEKENLGCAGGRKKALAEASGDYIVMLDNDLRVTPWWLENLLIRLIEAKADAVCCKVVLPDGSVQYNGGSYRIQNGFIQFSFMDSQLYQDHQGTMIVRECRWLPGGATLYRREVFSRVQYCEGLRGGLEDNDLSLQMARAGLKMVNCPAARVVHHHHAFDAVEMGDSEYSKVRNDRKKMLDSAVVFYRRNGLIVYDPQAFKYLGIPHGTREETRQFFRNLVEKSGSVQRNPGSDEQGGNTKFFPGFSGEDNGEKQAKPVKTHRKPAESPATHGNADILDCGPAKESTQKPDKGKTPPAWQAAPNPQKTPTLNKKTGTFNKAPSGWGCVSKKI